MLQHPSVPPTTNGASPVEEFDAPDDLAADERAVWLKQAPHAFAHGTLTRSSALAFERYCKVVALERRVARSEEVGQGNHRGLLKHLADLERDFLLKPDRKAMPAAAVPEAPVSKLSRFRKI